MVDLRYHVISGERKGRIWFHVVDSWAPLANSRPSGILFSSSTSDNAAQELNRIWLAREQRVTGLTQLKPD